MNLNILLSTSEYRGDHNADILVALDVNPQMSIEELAKRINGYDHIEIRIAHPVIAALEGVRGE